MSKNNFNDTYTIQPIENHDTAAWANINTQKPISKVPIPSEFEVNNSKDWVDDNKK